MKEILNLGIDIGSTTIKLVLLDMKNNIIYSKYERHYSNIKEAVVVFIKEVFKKYKDYDITVMITGSSGLSLSKLLGVSFIQEVIACTEAVEIFMNNTDVAIELGGEDAKITYFEDSLEQRMNGVCAGGTGAFIDQMATLLETDAEGLNELAKNYTIIYPIAARCGVFATDIQSLINEGATKEDIAASIFQAVVNQTISGLACGKPIKGNVAFLGGPLYFLSELRQRFIDTLKLKEEEILFPQNPQLFVAIGAAIESKKEKVITFEELLKAIDSLDNSNNMTTSYTLEPLFENEKELQNFRQRHYGCKARRER